MMASELFSGDLTLLAVGIEIEVITMEDNTELRKILKINKINEIESK